MEFKNDTIVVAERDLTEPVNGARPEPEEMPVQRTLESEAPMGFNAPSSLIASKGLDTRVVYEDITAEVAANVGGKQCHTCYYWSQKLWHALYGKWRYDKEHQNLLNSMRYQLSDDENGEVENELLSLGVCVALTDLNGGTENDSIFTQPEACCPDRMGDGLYKDVLQCPKCQRQFDVPDDLPMPCPACAAASAAPSNVRADRGEKNDVRSLTVPVLNRNDIVTITVKEPTKLPLMWVGRDTAATKLAETIYSRTMKIASGRKSRLRIVG